MQVCKKEGKSCDFKPFTLEITVESKEELNELYARFNTNDLFGLAEAGYKPKKVETNKGYKVLKLLHEECTNQL